MASKTVKIVGILGGLSLLGWIGYKVAPTLTKVAKIGDNIIPSVSFNRVHGLVNTGDFLQKLINPVLRIYINAGFKNFSGFNLPITNAFIKLDVQKPGSKEWSTVAVSPSRFTFDSKDGSDIIKELPLDITGWTTLSSIGNKLNKHRAVLVFDFKGIPTSKEFPLNIAQTVSAYTAKLKSSSLKGTEESNLNTMQLCM